jgi:hypothetical protein
MKTHEIAILRPDLDSARSHNSIGTSIVSTGPILTGKNPIPSPTPQTHLGHALYTVISKRATY